MLTEAALLGGLISLIDACPPFQMAVCLCRGAWVRRFRDLLRAHESDLGDESTLSEGQRSIIRRAAMLELQLELLESKFAGNDGAATARELESYQRASNSLRRLLESLDLHRGRRARDVTPTPLEYARQRVEAGS